MKNGTLLIEGFGLDENGRIMPAQPGQRHWQGMRWLTIARVDVTVDVDYDGCIQLLTARMDGDEITMRGIQQILDFRAPGANSNHIFDALNKIYWDGADVVSC